MRTNRVSLESPTGKRNRGDAGVSEDTLSKSKARRWRPSFRRMAVLLIGFWILNVIVMKCLEPYLVYRPCTAAESWQVAKFDHIEEVTYPSADGNTLRGWWMPHPNGGDAILLLHGNGGNLSHRCKFAQEMREKLGRSVLIADYPGYGKCTGEPSETGCCQAADAALDWLQVAHNLPTEKVILMGESLGGGVAVDAASRRGCAALCS